MKSPFDSKHRSTWCPGCGNFSILSSLKKSLEDQGLSPQDVLIVSGIGQAAKLPHYIHAHGLNGLHGRALPSAMGAHVANPSLKIIVTTGDGDSYGEGGNHFIHNIRRNLDLVHLVHDNQIYGLTKGQASPTTSLGQVTTLQIHGVRHIPLNPVALAIALDCSFVARSFSGRPDHLQEMLKMAMEHKGYALIDVLQPCVSFNKVNTFSWYQERVELIPEDHDPEDKVQAFTLAQKFGDEGIPIGLLYKSSRPSFMEQIPHVKKPLVEYERRPEDILPLLHAFR